MSKRALFRIANRNSKHPKGKIALFPEAVSADASKVKPLWSEDQSKRSLEEILASEAENRAWNKALRGQITALVDSRLAKKISQEAYATRRQHGNEDAAECRRRGIILVNEISSRGGRALPHKP